MADTLSSSIRKYAIEQGFDDELIENVVKQSLRTAYKKQYGTDENLDFETDDDGEIYMVSNKKVVEKVENPVFEISLKEAQNLDPESEIGDELAVEENVQNYNFHAVQAGKQRIQQSLKEVQKDILYAEYISKVGEIIIGYYHRENNGNVFVDLGKVEGFLPRKFQSPRDHFSHSANRIKALVKEVRKQRQSNTVQLVLSRSDSEFVKKIFEVEVPEIYSGVVEIVNIVREAGSRTKLSVLSNKLDVDPVGACVGPRGSRIQVVITELDGEKIDVVPYSNEPAEYIRAALSPAEVEDVIIVDEEKRSAIAIVDDSQLSLAIGRGGLNVRLANRLVDWNIEVKTEDQFKEMDSYKDIRQAAEELFASEDENLEETEEAKYVDEKEEQGETASSESKEEASSSDEEIQEEEIILSEEVADVLNKNGISDFDSILDMSEQDLAALDGMTDEMLKELLDIVNTYMNDEEEYECPECGHPITLDMTNCPNCGVGLIFEEYDDADDETDDKEQ